MEYLRDELKSICIRKMAKWMSTKKLWPNIWLTVKTMRHILSFSAEPILRLTCQKIMCFNLVHFLECTKVFWSQSCCLHSCAHPSLSVLHPTPDPWFKSCNRNSSVKMGPRPQKFVSRNTQCITYKIQVFAQLNQDQHLNFLWGAPSEFLSLLNYFNDYCRSNEYSLF